MGLADGSAAGTIWHKLGVSCLAVIALVCLHYFLYHLQTILIPFFLSGFIVFALQPSVEFVYLLLVGAIPPFRWCCCGFRRQRARSWLPETLSGGIFLPCWRSDPWASGAIGEEAAAEVEPLVSPRAFESTTTFIMEAICRFLAVSIVLLAVLLFQILIVFMLGHGASHMRDNWEAYRAGIARLERLQDRVIDRVVGELHVSGDVDQKAKEAYKAVLDEAQSFMWHVLNEIVSRTAEGLSHMIIIFLYVLFWLMQPLPLGGKASLVVRSYLWKKAYVSFLYGLCVAVLFYSLSIDLAMFFGVVSFFLNFVPEVGAFISMILPVPVILLDARLKSPFLVLTLSLVGQLFLKFIFGNILEVKLIERDKEMNIHPVWVILGLSYFGFIWGPTGMLISVPMLAMLKTVALAAKAEHEDDDHQSVVTMLAEGFLACFEGRKPIWYQSGSSLASSIPSSPSRYSSASPVPRVSMAPAMGVIA